jgi:hypothetical protein
VIERKREMREKDTYIVIKGYTVRKRARQLYNRIKKIIFCQERQNGLREKKVPREGGEHSVLRKIK